VLSALGGAALDLLEVTDIARSFTDRKATPFERGFHFGKGIAQLATFVIGGRKFFARGGGAPPPPEPPLLPPGPEPIGLLPPGPEPVGLLPPGPEPIALLPPGPEPVGLLPPGPEPAGLLPAPPEPAGLLPAPPEPAGLLPAPPEPAGLLPPAAEVAPPPVPEPAAAVPAAQPEVVVPPEEAAVPTPAAEGPLPVAEGVPEPELARTIERGEAILEEFASRSGTREEQVDDLLEELDLEPRRTYPGRAPQPETFDVGNFSHEYAEQLIPESELPRGLDREFTIELPEQGEVRLDRVDWDNGTIYEIKPDTPSQVEAGERQAQLYENYMNEHYPRGGGRTWTSRVVTYRRDAVIAFLRSIGWLQ
jgi:hypothetical protein